MTTKKELKHYDVEGQQINGGELIYYGNYKDLRKAIVLYVTPTTLKLCHLKDYDCDLLKNIRSPKTIVFRKFKRYAVKPKWYKRNKGDAYPLLDNSTEQIEWVEENLTGEWTIDVYNGIGYFAFKDNEDSMAYILRW